MTKTEGALMFTILLAAVLIVGYRQERFNTRLVLALRQGGRGHRDEQRQVNRAAEQRR